MKAQNTSLFQKDLLREAFIQSFVKLNPKIMFRNPVMFTVEIGTAVMLGVCLWILSGETTQGSFAYNFIVSLVLFLTLIFADGETYPGHSFLSACLILPFFHHPTFAYPAKKDSCPAPLVYVEL